jgi:decaprenylphospho-beta-D-erythro-pentofuranosid-2-ulose 2-reductase
MSVNAADVAAAVEKALAGSTDIVWVPAGLRVVMSGLRHLPRPVFRRLKI